MRSDSGQGQARGEQQRVDRYTHTGACTYTALTGTRTSSVTGSRQQRKSSPQQAMRDRAVNGSRR